MSTQHEVGPMPSETVNADPLVVVVPLKHLNLVLVGIISFLVPLAGLIMAVHYNKKVTAHNAQDGVAKISPRNYWLVVGISVALAFTAVVATHLPSNNLNNMTFTVVGTGPVAPSVQPSQAAPQVTAGPIEPVASTPEGTIRAVEAYRIQAFMTGDPAPLANYFAVGNNAGNDRLYRQAIERVNSVRPGHFIGHMSLAVTKVVMVSVTPTKMVANVTVYETANGKVIDNFTYNWRTYVVVNGRWLESYARNMT